MTDLILDEIEMIATNAIALKKVRGKTAEWEIWENIITGKNITLTQDQLYSFHKLLKILFNDLHEGRGSL